MFEHILAQLATAQGCMTRIENNLPLKDVITKGKSIKKAIVLIGQLDATLDMDRGQAIAQNLRALYTYMLDRLTMANVHNDANAVAEVAGLVHTIKAGWDKVVEEQ